MTQLQCLKKARKLIPASAAEINVQYKYTIGREGLFTHQYYIYDWTRGCHIIASSNISFEDLILKLKKGISEKNGTTL
jgi:hypothetical protein